MIENPVSDRQEALVQSLAKEGPVSQEFIAKRALSELISALVSSFPSTDELKMNAVISDCPSHVLSSASNLRECAAEFAKWLIANNKLGEYFGIIRRDKAIGSGSALKNLAQKFKLVINSLEYFTKFPDQLNSFVQEIMDANVLNSSELSERLKQENVSPNDFITLKNFLSELFIFSEWRQFLRANFDLREEVVIDSGTMPVRVHAALEYLMLEKEISFRDIISAALKERGRNPELIRFAQSLGVEAPGIQEPARVYKPPVTAYTRPPTEPAAKPYPQPYTQPHPQPNRVSPPEASYPPPVPRYPETHQASVVPDNSNPPVDTNLPSRQEIKAIGGEYVQRMVGFLNENPDLIPILENPSGSLIAEMRTFLLASLATIPEDVAGSNRWPVFMHMLEQMGISSDGNLNVMDDTLGARFFSFINKLISAGEVAHLAAILGMMNALAISAGAQLQWALFPNLSQIVSRLPTPAAGEIYDPKSYKPVDKMKPMLIDNPQITSSYVDQLRRSLRIEMEIANQQLPVAATLDFLVVAVNKFEGDIEHKWSIFLQIISQLNLSSPGEYEFPENNLKARMFNVVQYWNRSGFFYEGLTILKSLLENTAQYGISINDVQEPLKSLLMSLPDPD